MSFDRFFRLSSHALVVTGFCALVMTRQLDPVSILLYVLVLVLAWLIDEGWLAWHLPRRASTLAIWILLPLVFVEWKFLGASPALVIMHFVLLASALKLLGRKQLRDWLWLYVVSFGQLLMSAGLLVGPEFLALLIVYLFVGIQALIAFEIRRSMERYNGERAADGDSELPVIEVRHRRRKPALWRVERPRWSKISLHAVLILIGIIVLAVPAFLLLPRVARGSARQGLLATESLSGFSDNVRLGEVAEVKLNPRVVMRVRVSFPKGAAPRALRWRGVTLDYYDGSNWIESGTRTMAMRKTENAFVLDRRPSRLGVTEQRMMLEPLSVNTLFAAARPVFLIGPDVLTQDSGEGLWTSPHPTSQIAYRVFSDTSRPSPDELKLDNSRVYPTDIRKRYLQLPPSHDPRITRLAEELTRGATTQYEMVQRIEDHLRTAYGYSLSLGRSDDSDPVADFLFNLRKGHCEYFASAMVLLLRSRRIPARLVNGFQMGEYNPSGDFYTVRQSDAHSWVEVWFPDSGWVDFEPTPAAGLSSYDQGWLGRLRQYREVFKMFWLENVVGFDTRKQIAVATGLRRWISQYQRGSYYRWNDWISDLAERAASLREEGWSWPTLTGMPTNGDKTGRVRALLSSSWWLLAVIITALIVAAIPGYRLLANWLSRRQAVVDPASQALKFYGQMLRIVARLGYRRLPSQTPAEFAASVPLAGVAEITDFYHRTRFGHRPLADSEMRLIEGYLRGLRRQASTTSTPGSG